MRTARCTVVGLLLLLTATVSIGSGDSQTPLDHRRGPEQTFLTFPEWFLVFSPAEYADLVKTEYPNKFPFWGHIRQFWQSYAEVTRATLNHHFKFNGGYHVMIMVIGTSTTVEYAVRSAYETIVGRLSALTAREHTAEDIYAAEVAQEYVDFIRESPWYDFNFLAKLKGLWDVPIAGDGLIRKLERRYALTSEYLLKAMYGWIIGIGTHASYEKPKLVTAVIVEPKIDNAALHYLPRYEAFTEAATALAKGGGEFIEIAGNDSQADILISVLAASNWQLPINAKLLFQQPIITSPGTRRFVFVVPVGALAATLRRFQDTHVKIEHVFDY